MLHGLLSSIGVAMGYRVGVSLQWFPLSSAIYSSLFHSTAARVFHCLQSPWGYVSFLAPLLCLVLYLPATVWGRLANHRTNSLFSPSPNPGEKVEKGDENEKQRRLWGLCEVWEPVLITIVLITIVLITIYTEKKKLTCLYRTKTGAVKVKLRLRKRQ